MTGKGNPIEYENPWLWRGEPFLDTTGWAGMTYLITNLRDDRLYVGKKFFWKREKRKGKRTRWVSSDWRQYYGSSKALQGDVAVHGRESFRREVLSLHPTRGGVNYTEVREQFARDVLYDDRYYNDAVARFQNVRMDGSVYTDKLVDMKAHIPYDPVVINEGDDE